MLSFRDLNTASKLYATVTGEAIPQEGDTVAKSGCAICGDTSFSYGFSIAKKFDRYGEHSLFSLHSDTICPYCYLATQDKNRTTKGVFIYYNGENDKKIIFLSNNTTQQDKEEFIRLTFEPPKGLFLLAFNWLKQKETHYIPFGVINYNEGDCNKYIATIWTNPVVMDLEFLRKYKTFLDSGDSFKNIEKYGITWKEIEKNKGSRTILEKFLKLYKNKS